MRAIAPAKCWQYPRFVLVTNWTSGAPWICGGVSSYVKPPLERSHASIATAAA